MPTPSWLRAGSRDSHLMAALAFYQMWKNHQNGRPVTMVLEDADGADYIRIARRRPRPGARDQRALSPFSASAALRPRGCGGARLAAPVIDRAKR